MIPTFFTVLLSLATLSSSRSVSSSASTPKIQWINCSDSVPITLQQQNLTLPTPLPSTLKCGQLDVPLDYSKPFSKTNKITLGFSMYRPHKPKGLINFNPGGPAVEVSSYAWQFALGITEVANFTGLEEFDFLAMDPRGTFSSTPLNCSAENLTLSSKIPSTKDEFQAYTALGSKYFQSCTQLTSPPEYVKLVGTDQVIQDINQIREALCYDEMNFLAFSYGTVEAAAFAHKYPKNTGRFIVDGMAPPGLTNLEYVSFQIKDANRLLLRADAYCIFDANCPFHAKGKGSVPTAFATILKNANAGKYPNITADDIRAMTGIIYFLGSPDFLAFNQALFTALNGDASGFDYSSFESIYTPSLLTTIPIFCADQHVEATTFAEFSKTTQALKAFDTADFRYSQVLSILAICTGWPIHGNLNQPRDIKVPMMLVSADFDLNTPMETVQRQFDQAPQSTALIRHGDTHISFLVPSEAREHEIAFLQTGRFPHAHNDTLLTIYAPGSKIGKPQDPYAVPSGPLGGDLKST